MSGKNRAGKRTILIDGRGLENALEDERKIGLENILEVEGKIGLESTLF